MHRISRYNFTIIEILMVLLITGILLAISIRGLTGIIKGQGASGAVRTISSKLSMARSYAVVKNSYVAMLLPNDNNLTPVWPYTEENNSSVIFTTEAFKNYFYTKMRLCYVKYDTSDPSNKKYVFEDWIDGSEWYELPEGTCAYINANPIKVLNINIGGVSNFNAPAVIFRPSGLLAGNDEVALKVFLATYNPISSALVYQKKSKAGLGWDITINQFSGRVSYAKANPKGP